MPPSHDAPGPDAQITSSGPPLAAATNAMTAKVGAAANDSQSATLFTLRSTT